MSVDPEIFPIFQHKVERIPHFARVIEVRHIYLHKKCVSGIKPFNWDQAPVFKFAISLKYNVPCMQNWDKRQEKRGWIPELQASFSACDDDPLNHL